MQKPRYDGLDKFAGTCIRPEGMCEHYCKGRSSQRAVYTTCQCPDVSCPYTGTFIAYRDADKPGHDSTNTHKDCAYFKARK